MRLRFSLATVFSVVTYLCVMAALAGVFRYWLLGPGPVERLPSLVAIQLFVGGGFVLMSVGVGSYFVRRLTRVHRSRPWPRTTAIVLPPPERRHPLQEKARGEFGQLYVVNFVFEVQGRRRTSRLWTTQRCAAGDKRPLAFDAADPSRHCFDPGSDTGGAVYMMVFALIFGGIGLGLLFL